MLDYIYSTLIEAKKFTEIDPEDDCPAFRSHAISYLKEVIRVTDDTRIKNYCGRAIGALVVGKLREADEAIQEALDLLRMEVR